MRTPKLSIDSNGSLGTPICAMGRLENLKPGCKRDAHHRLVLWHRDPYVSSGSSAAAFPCDLWGHEAFIAIETGEVIEGGLPKTAGRLVKEWTLARRDQLRENWRRARAGEQPERIAGLDAD
jgi:hypothetical protein